MGKRISQAKRQRQKQREFRDTDRNGRKLAVLPIEKIFVDADRFQYKLNCTKDGSVNSLAGVASWSFAAEGVLDVWLCPITEQTYVVNGHNRLARAKSLGLTHLPVKYLIAATSDEAKEQGAVANIAAGCGTALDAAQFFRAGRWDKARCKRYGIRLGQAVARDGLAIARLCDGLFYQALSNALPLDRAAAIGAAGLAASEQIALARAIKDREDRGQPVGADVVREMAALSRVAARQEFEQATLFGVEQFEVCLIFEQAIVAAGVRALLASDRRAFATVTRHADTLEGAGNQIAREASASRADWARDALARFDAAKLVAGPIATAIATAAARLAAGESKQGAIALAYEQILEVL